MLNNKTIAVVIPAYNEENQIGHVIETMPDFVDRIVVVNDQSKDKTSDIVRQYMKKDNKETITIQSVLNNVKKTKYNQADWLVQEHIKKELEYFPPSEVVNNNPSKEHVILINQKKNTEKRMSYCLVCW